jgi:Bifunctional DNA primase/polymerase, N-terminal
MSALTDAAVRLATEAHCHVFPLRPGGKTPATGHGCLDATTDPGEIRAMWSRHGAGCNIGIATGPSRLVVVDLDGPAGAASWRELTADHPIEALTAVTPRGRHLYFRALVRRPIRNSASKIGPGVDVRGEGGYVVAPPSRRPEGGYVWLPGPRRLASLPGWLADLADPPKPIPRPRLPVAAGADDGALSRLVGFVLQAQEGQRNAALYWAACRADEYALAGQLPAGVAAAALTLAAREIGLGEHEIAATIRSGLRAAA